MKDMSTLGRQAPTIDLVKRIRGSFSRSVFLFLLLGTLVVLAYQPAPHLQYIAAAAAKPSPSPTPSNNTTSTIYDKSVDDQTFLDLRSDDLNPDLTPTGGSFGIYGTSSTTNVVDRLEGYQNSDWSLHTEDSATRWISFSLNRLTGSGPTGDYVLH